MLPIITKLKSASRFPKTSKSYDDRARAIDVCLRGNQVIKRQRPAKD